MISTSSQRSELESLGLLSGGDGKGVGVKRDEDNRVVSAVCLAVLPLCLHAHNQVVIRHPMETDSQVKKKIESTSSICVINGVVGSVQFEAKDPQQQGTRHVFEEGSQPTSLLFLLHLIAERRASIRKGANKLEEDKLVAETSRR